jgi:transposase InsO family protein
LSEEFRQEIKEEVRQVENVRLTKVLAALDIAASSWYRRPLPQEQRRRPGPPLKVVEPQVVEAVVKMATENPWYGYRRIAVMCRRLPEAVSDEDAYRVMRQHGLLQKQRRVREPELYQALKLYELLPQRPNDLWQMDVTYLHIPGFGWWYAVTVIDYYSRYLLACHLTSSYCAVEAIHALGLARQEAERLHGPLTKTPFLVTDNGSSFIAKRFCDYLKDRYSHVRIQYRTPTQLGLLERFHKTLKLEEVYWRLYDNPGHARQCLEEFRQRYNERRPHWALVPETGGDPLVPLEVYTAGMAIRIPKWQGWAKGAKEKLDQMLAGEAA